MIEESADRLRSRIGELENELSHKNITNNTDSSGGAGGRAPGSEGSSRGDESSEERAEVMHTLLKELRTELIHKEEVRCLVEYFCYLHDDCNNSQGLLLNIDCVSLRVISGHGSRAEQERAATE